MRTLWPAIGLLLAFFCAAPASSDEPMSLVPLRPSADPETMPLNRILERIAVRVPGRALDVKMRERDGSPVYRVKWLGEDGKVREVVTDAQSGKIIEVR